MEKKMKAMICVFCDVCLGYWRDPLLHSVLSSRKIFVRLLAIADNIFWLA